VQAVVHATMHQLTARSEIEKQFAAKIETLYKITLTTFTRGGRSDIMKFGLQLTVKPISAWIGQLSEINIRNPSVRDKYIKQ
jgi:hypothetical protein